MNISFGTVGILLIVFVSIFFVNKVKANLYAGAQVNICNGARAYISTLNEITVDGNGESNWASTIYVANGYTDWIHAGWRFTSDYLLPKQYVEYCDNCNDLEGDYYIDDDFGSQFWRSTIH